MPISAEPGKTILIAEDEAMLRLVAVETLRDAGYEVREAGDGDAALAILTADESIDLLITDIKMPGMSGYQLTDAGMRLRPHLKVLLMTGYMQDPMPAQIAAAGVGVLHKPFDIEQLPELARRILGGA